MRFQDQVLHHNKKVKSYLVTGKYSEAENAACKVVKNIFEAVPTLGIDIDGTIDENPHFFSVLSNTWPGRVVIITCRNDRSKAIKDLDNWGIYYDHLVLAKRLCDKPQLIKDNSVDIFIDDQDECLQDIPNSVTVMKIRNGGNYDTGSQKWFYSQYTGEKV
ncbi:hypothetical protein N9045_01045 [bacterium]|nr:hypothetical protein [bacterium]